MKEEKSGAEILVPDTKGANTSTKVLGGIKNYIASQFIPLLVLLIIIIAASLISPVFLSKANLENLVLQMAVTMIVSCGMFLVILTGGIDLSVGSIVGVTSVFVAGWLQPLGVPLAILLAVLVGGLIGFINGVLVAKVKLAPFIVTLGMMSFARGVAYWYTDAVPILWTSVEGTDIFKEIGGGRLFGVLPIPALIWLLVFLVTVVIVRKSVVGRVTYAIGGNEEAVRLTGISTIRYKIFPYVITGLYAGIAGVVLAARLGVGAPANGEGLELDCVAATVIGGTSLSGGAGSISGVVIGVFILSIINNILNLSNVPSYPQKMLKGVIIVVAVILSSIKNKKVRA